MAIKMLMKTPRKISGDPDDMFCHSSKHDLESLFYVLLYVCTFYSAPGEKLQPAELLKERSSVPILEWVDPEAHSKSFRSMGHLKMGHLMNFERSIIAKISPFFRPIQSGLIALKNAIFPPTSSHANVYFDNQITHSAMAEIFDAMLNDIDNGTPPRKKIRPTSD